MRETGGGGGRIMKRKLGDMTEKEEAKVKGKRKKMATLRLKDVNTKLYLRAISEYLCANLQEGEQAMPRLAHGRIKSYVSL